MKAHGMTTGMNHGVMGMGRGLDRPEPPPPPRAIPPDIDLGLAPKLLLGLGVGMLAISLLSAAAFGSERNVWLLVHSAVHGIAGVVLLAFAVRVWTRRRALSQHGLVARAHVFANTVYRSTSEDNQAHIDPTRRSVGYRYDVGHEDHDGWFSMPAPGPPVGALLWVIYDPARPRRHLRFK